MTAETPATAGTATGTPGQAAGLLEQLHALAAKWDATADRNQRNGQSLLDQGDEYGSEGLAVAEALGVCHVELTALLTGHQAIAAAPQPAPASLSQVRRHAEQRDAPELAAVLEQHPEAQPAPGLLRELPLPSGAVAESCACCRTWGEAHEALRERIAAIAHGLEQRAEINRPSKVSDLRDEIAADLREALDPR